MTPGHRSWRDWDQRTTKAMDEHIFTYQEDGTSSTDFAALPITYTGTWGVGNCDCFLAGHTAFTTKSGDRATFTRTYEQGDQVALVMAEGPGRGVASIRIDGKWFMNVDTFAATNTNRVVVFAMGMSAGDHTVAIVNHGTPREASDRLGRRAHRAIARERTASSDREVG